MASNSETQKDAYLSISSSAEGLYKESGSRFLSLAYPVTSPEQANDIVTSVKKKYHDATHHCYAYRIGKEGEIYRLNDDGEPSSSAGRPIYGEILSAGLSDILVIVVRWFGGVKLGIPGLIRSYKNSTADAIANAYIITKVATLPVVIKFPYNHTNLVLREIKKVEGEIVEKSFEQDCTVKALIPISNVQTLKNLLNLPTPQKEIFIT